MLGGIGAGTWQNAELWRRFVKDGSPGAPCGRDSQKTSDLLAVAAMRRIGAEISITTDEGDTVTLSLHSELDASFAVYRRPASSERDGLEAASISVSKTSGIEISVEGDLNERERADVQKLVRQLSQVIRGFLAGSFDTGVVRSFDDVASNSLAGFTLHVERAESVTLLRDQGAPQDSRATTKPSTEPVPFAPTALDPGTQEPVVQWGEQDSGRRTRDIDRVLGEIMKLARESGLDMGRFGRHVERAMRSLLHRIGRDPAIEPARPALEEISARLPDSLGGAQDADASLMRPSP